MDKMVVPEAMLPVTQVIMRMIVQQTHTIAVVFVPDFVGGMQEAELVVELVAVLEVLYYFRDLEILALPDHCRQMQGQAELPDNRTI
jgi:hypothetical protein